MTKLVNKLNENRLKATRAQKDKQLRVQSFIWPYTMMPREDYQKLLQRSTLKDWLAFL